MKLLLTSAGITNQSLADELIVMANKPKNELRIGFVPTASNIEPGAKVWFLEQLDNLRRFGFEWIDIIDIADDGVDWKSRLEIVDVIFVSGGNTFYLLEQVRKSGFSEWLSTALKEKVYVGSSAGSIILTPDIGICDADPGDENFNNLQDLTGLSIVDFEISPHSPETVTYESNEEYARTIKNKLYCIDDETAISVSDGKMEIISDGRYKILD